MAQQPPVEVLAFGDSSATWVGPDDTDRRRLFAMVGDELGGRVATHVVAGPSYHVDLIVAFLDLVRSSGQRPVVVVPLWVRGRFVPWVQHPTWGHQKALAHLRAQQGSERRRLHAALRHPDDEDFAAFETLPFPTLLGPGSVADYALPLKDPRAFAADPAARERLIYAYHHGARLESDQPTVEGVRALGRCLRDLGWPFVAFETPVPVTSGEQHLGPDFRKLVEHNFAVLREALAQGVGREVEVVRSGTAFPASHFIDPSLADEHLNQEGRRRLAAMIADPLRGHLSPVRPRPGAPA